MIFMFTIVLYGVYYKFLCISYAYYWITVTSLFLLFNNSDILIRFIQ